MSLRSEQEERIYDQLHYPGEGPRVPVNKLDFRTWPELERAEAQFIEYRIKQGLPAAAMEWNYAGLKALHGHLFQDVYEWAGVPRTYTTGRKYSFGPPEFLEATMNKLFVTLASEHHLQNLAPGAFSERAAKYVNDLNAAHPFIEGNGRVQRLWLQNLAEQAGYTIDLSGIDKGQWYHASSIGFTSSDRPMAVLLKANLASIGERRIHAETLEQPAVASTHPVAPLAGDDVLVPARELPDLSEGEIGAQLAASGRLADKRGEIERLSRLVYGDPLAVSTWVEKIDGAASGQTAAADVMAGQPGPLAGEGVGWFRSESPERQSAQAHLPQLAQALEDYGRAIDFERHRAVRTHADEQYRHRQEIPAPSRELADVLQSVPQEQQARLRAAPALREELGRISLALERRLSPSDKAALYKDDHARLAQSLSIPQERAAAISRLATQTGLVQQQTRRQSLERGPEHVLTR